MARSKKPPKPQPEGLAAIIETVEQTYYIADYQQGDTPLGDESIIDIVGRIEQISPRHIAHLGEKVGISLICARSFAGKEPTPVTDRPILYGITLRKNQHSALAYLPADAFWALPPMIRSGAITHIELRFNPIHRGSADLVAIHLAPASKLTLTT
jgi:hypothetical protein